MCNLMNYYEVNTCDSNMYIEKLNKASIPNPTKYIPFLIINLVLPSQK